MYKLSIPILTFTILTSGCSTRETYVKENQKKLYKYTEITKKSYTHPTMKPYEIMGIKYYPHSVNVGEKSKGNASWYGPDFHGKLTSNGETYDMMEMTAAHKTFPMNTVVKVINKDNGLSTVVRINDRGPFVATRIIDLSKAAAKKIDMIGKGTASIVIEVLGFASRGDTEFKIDIDKLSNSQQVNKFYLQIGSFVNIDGAMKIQEKYNGTDGYKTIIKDIETNNGRVFKVFLDGFKDRKEIVEYQESEKSYFNNAFIVKGDS